MHPSVRVYAAVMYLRIETKGTYLKFVKSNTRVAPLIEQTILRLELLFSADISPTGFPREIGLRKFHSNFACEMLV